MSVIFGQVSLNGVQVVLVHSEHESVVDGKSSTKTKKIKKTQTFALVILQRKPECTHVTVISCAFQTPVVATFWWVSVENSNFVDTFRWSKACHLCIGDTHTHRRGTLRSWGCHTLGVNVEDQTNALVVMEGDVFAFQTACTPPLGGVAGGAEWVFQEAVPTEAVLGRESTGTPSVCRCRAPIQHLAGRITLLAGVFVGESEEHLTLPTCM